MLSDNAAAGNLIVVARLFGVAHPIDSHVVLGDEGRYLQLIHVYHVVQVFNARYQVHLFLDGRCRECQKPPLHHLRQKKHQ